MHPSRIQKTNELHNVSDKDSSGLALHHTLGPKKYQASPGDHTHSGTDGSKTLPQIATIAETNFDSHLRNGTEVVTFATATSNIRTVTLPTMPAAPALVIPVISSGAGTTTGWTCRTDTYTTNSFRLLLAGPSQAWSSVNVHWLAFYA